MNGRLSRRRFVQGAALAGLTLPLLPSLLSRSARADGAAPLRFIALVTQQGQRVSGYVCSGGERDFALSEVLEPLAPYRDRMIAMHRLSGFQHGHPNGSASALCEGWTPDSSAPAAYAEHYHQGPSLDQVLAQRFGGETALPSLQLGVKTAHGGYSSFAAPDLKIPPIASPRAAFERIAGVSLGDPELAMRARAQALTVTDAAARNFESVLGRLSASERRIVDAHLTELRSHEERLMGPIRTATCEPPERPGDVADDAGFDVHTEAQFENLILALRCDVTRIVSVSWGKGESNYPFPFIGIDDAWHAVAHGTVDDSNRKHNRIKRWHFERIAELCRRLGEIPDVDGRTLLDNTVIFVADELQITPDDGLADSHARRNMPAVVIGDAQGWLDTGRFLSCGGRPYGDLLFTLAHALGATDLTTFGARGGPHPSAPPPAALLDELRA